MRQEEKRIKGMTGRRYEELTIRPTSEWALIPVTRPDGGPGFIRRQIYASASGRTFVLDGSGFAEVRRTALGGYCLTGSKFVTDEGWQAPDTNANRNIDQSSRRMPIWNVPNVPTSKDDGYEMSF